MLYLLSVPDRSSRKHEHYIVHSLANLSFYVHVHLFPQHFFPQLSLFFDILLCLTTDITKEDYIAGTFKQPQAISSGVISTESQSPGESVMRRARAKLWKNLREADLKMKAGEKRGEGERRAKEREGEERVHYFICSSSSWC